MAESFYIGGNTARMFRDHHLGTMSGLPPYRDDSRFVLGSLEKLVQKPGPLDVDTLLDREVFTSKGAVEDLGLDPAVQSDWAKFLEQVVYGSEEEPILRQQLFEKMRAEDWDRELRQIMFKRAMSLYRNTRKSVVTVDDLQKGEATAGQLSQVFTPDDLAKAKEKLPGGLGDGKKDSDFDPEQVKMGQKVEREHSDDPAKISEIVRDHLTEDPKYYTKLKTIEKAAKEGGMYHRRVAYKSKDGKDKHRYFYTEDAYNRSKVAHQSGEEMAKQALHKDLDGALDGAGEQGCSPDDLKKLAKKHGGKTLAKTLAERCGKEGNVKYKGGRFYGAKKEKKNA